MWNKISMLFLAVLLVGLLAGCVLRRDESRDTKDSMSSSFSATATFTIAATGAQPNVEQSLSKTTATTTTSSNTTESKKQVQDTLKLIEELEIVLNSLDTVREQDLLKP